MTPLIMDADTIVGFWPIRNVDISLTRLQRCMMRHGVSRACICSARGIWYDYLEGNEETVQLAQADPRFIPVMTLDPRRWLGCRDEIRRRVAEGHRLFRLFPEYQGWSLGLTSARRLLSFLEEEGAVVMLGGPADAAVPAVRGLQTPVVLLSCHFYHLGEVLASADDLRHVYISTRFLMGTGSLCLAARDFDAERLVFGSHAPLAYLAPALRVIRSADLSDDTRAAILGGNLRRLLGGVYESH